MPKPFASQLLHAFSTFAIGGPQTRFAAIANHFGRRYRHAIVAMDGNYACRERLEPGLDIDFPLGGLIKSSAVGNISFIRRFLRQTSPDLLVTYNWGAIDFAMANTLNPVRPRPLIRHIHAEDGFGPQETDRQLVRRVMIRRLYLRRSTVVVPSQTLRRIATEVWRLDPARILYIANGVARSSASTPCGQVEATPHGRPCVGTVAALRPEKNLGRLLRAFRRVADKIEATLVVVGDGPDRPYLERLSGQLGLEQSVQFLGHVEQPQKLYPTFDIFALSSDTEQMPITVLEAMAAGLPIVAPDVGDIGLVVAPENKALITKNNEEALAEALLRLLHDARLRRRIGSANRLRVSQDFSQEAMFQAYQRLFDPVNQGA